MNTDPRVIRMRRQGISEADAEALIKAGLDTPQKIKRTHNKDLPEGINVEAVRKAFPKVI